MFIGVHYKMVGVQWQHYTMAEIQMSNIFKLLYFTCFLRSWCVEFSCLAQSSDRKQLFVPNLWERWS